MKVFLNTTDLKNPTIEITPKKLKVKSIRYFETRRGVGYQAKTNIKGVEIWNDGYGGETYLSETYQNTRNYDHLTEWELENLLNDYEKVNK